MSARQSIKLFISRELFRRKAGWTVLVWKLSAIFINPRYILRFHRIHQIFPCRVPRCLFKHQLFFNIIRIWVFHFFLLPSLIHTLSTSNLFYQFGSQPAIFFSLLFATFDVFLLLLKALRKLAAPVRRRNQNMLRCN